MTMIEEKKRPRLKPKSMLQSMIPSAMNEPIVRMPLRNEKSALVVKAVKVSHPNNKRVITPAVGITSGEL